MKILKCEDCGYIETLEDDIRHDNARCAPCNGQMNLMGKLVPLSVPFNEMLGSPIEERDSWISVNERRPNEHDDLLVYYNPHSKMFPKARYMTESSYYDACFEIESDEGYEVTHWQPLPEPPKAA